MANRTLSAEQLADLEGPGPWVPMTDMGTDWTASVAPDGLNPLAARSLPGGDVELRGDAFKGGAPGSVVFRLPVQFRPLYDTFVMVGDQGDTTVKTGFVRGDQNPSLHGQVDLDFSPVGDVTWDGVIFNKGATP